MSAAIVSATGARVLRSLRPAAEGIAALAIAACLIACAIHPLLQDSPCEQAGGIDAQLASLVVRILGGDHSSLEVRDRLRAEALEGSPAGRWETPSEKAAVALASCDAPRLARASIDPDVADLRANDGPAGAGFGAGAGSISTAAGPALAMAW